MNETNDEGRDDGGTVLTRSSFARSQHFAHTSPLKAIKRTKMYRMKLKRKRETLPCTTAPPHSDEQDLSTQGLPMSHPHSPRAIDSTDDYCDLGCQSDTELPTYKSASTEDLSIISIDAYNDYEPLTELLPMVDTSVQYDEGHDSNNEYNSTDEQFSVDPAESTTSDATYSTHGHPSVMPSNVLLKQFIVRHHLTQDAVSDLLELLSIYSPTYKWPASAYLFNKQFETTNRPIYHYFCSECYQSLPSKSEKQCPNLCCSKEFMSKGDISAFIQLPLQPQFKSLMQRESCFKAVHLTTAHRNHQAGSIADICDGYIYTELIKNSGTLPRSHTTITVVLNTDGVPVFRSSSFSFWPIHLLVNELPYRVRISKENRLLGGLWYGNSKPDMSLFLKPVVDSLTDLYFEGFTIQLQSGKHITFHVSVVACTCDLPARATVMNMVQFNGYFGCSHCKQKGLSKATHKGGRIHIFPYDYESPTSPLRCDREHQIDALKAVETESPVHGIKGPSILQSIPNFDLFKGMSFDYMHLVLLGVTRKLLQLWFTKTHHSEIWYLGNVVKDIDILLCSICPPNEIKRTPRSIDTTMKYWKAHELKTWLLHYSPVVLNGILPDDYYQHHLLLTEGIFLLLKDVVTNDDIVQSDKLLNHYCFLFSTLYDEKYMTLNVHGLLHLPEIVYNLGPLWAHSCFPFEAANGDLLKFFHGSSGIEMQVIEHINIIQELPLLENVFIKDSKEEQLYNRMGRRKHEEKQNCCLIEDGYCLHGKPQPYQLSQEDLELFQLCNVMVPNLCAALYKKVHLTKSDRIVVAPSKVKRLRDNSAVFFINNSGLKSYGKFQKAICFDTTSSEKVCFIIINQLTPALKKLCKDSITDAQLNDHIIVLNPSRKEDKVLVSISSIIDKCIIMDLTDRDGCVYVSHLPNCTETE